MLLMGRCPKCGGLIHGWPPNAPSSAYCGDRQCELFHGFSWQPLGNMTRDVPTAIDAPPDKEVAPPTPFVSLAFAPKEEFNCSKDYFEKDTKSTMWKTYVCKVCGWRLSNIKFPRNFSIIFDQMKDHVYLKHK